MRLNDGQNLPRLTATTPQPCTDDPDTLDAAAPHVHDDVEQRLVEAACESRAMLAAADAGLAAKIAALAIAEAEAAAANEELQWWVAEANAFRSAHPDLTASQTLCKSKREQGKKGKKGKG